MNARVVVTAVVVCALGAACASSPETSSAAASTSSYTPEAQAYKQQVWGLVGGALRPPGPGAANCLVAIDVDRDGSYVSEPKIMGDCPPPSAEESVAVFRRIRLPPVPDSVNVPFRIYVPIDFERLPRLHPRRP